MLEVSDFSEEEICSIWFQAEASEQRLLVSYLPTAEIVEQGLMCAGEDEELQDLLAKRWVELTDMMPPPLGCFMYMRSHSLQEWHGPYEEGKLESMVERSILFDSSLLFGWGGDISRLDRYLVKSKADADLNS